MNTVYHVTYCIKPRRPIVERFALHSDAWERFMHLGSRPYARDVRIATVEYDAWQMFTFNRRYT